MSLFDLKSLVGSQEDFADAHEPLNDGIKEVPNAQTVAASVKTGDVGKDTTSQGPAKVVPEKPDTDDETKTEHNVVKESAEKSGGGAPAASPTPAGKDSGSGNESSAKPAESEKADEETESESEPLEHQSEKSAQDELEKTEKAKEALEAYAPKAKRFDIIGHPTRQAEQISKVVGYVQRRSGNKGAVTVSAESIDNAIVLSQTRIAKLEREVRILSKRKVSNEDIADSMGIDNPQLVEEIAVTEAPTEHGAPPMDPTAAAALTEAELDPLDVPMLEIQKVRDTIGVLEAGGAAIEQYREIIRANPKMSKQAAAVLQAGLEHIDQVCSLRARATGMESYLTTPRAAMEEAKEVKEKSLGDRAAEIGAKILKWLQHLYEHAEQFWGRLTNGITESSLRAKALKEAITKMAVDPGGQDVTLAKPPTDAFVGDEFVGDYVSRGEWDAVIGVNMGIEFIEGKLVKPMLRILRGDNFETMAAEIEKLGEAIESGDTSEMPLPGGWVIDRKGANFEIRDTDDFNIQDNYTFTSDSRSKLVNQVSDMIKFLGEMADMDVLRVMGSVKDSVSKELMAIRKRSKLSEEEFQKIQSLVMKYVLGPLTVDNYFKIMRHLVIGINTKIVIVNAIVKQVGNAKAEPTEE